MLRTSTAALCALALAACARGELARVDAAELRTPRALAVTVDDGDRARRLLGPWSTATAPDPVLLADDEASLWLVGVDPAQLVGQTSALDLDGPLTPRLGAPCSGPAAPRLERDVALPDDAPALGVTPGEPGVERRARADVPALGAIVLRGALDYGRCRRPGEERFSPFGAAEGVLPAHLTVEGAGVEPELAVVTDFVRLDRDRLVVITPTAVLLVHRGRAFADVEGAARLLPGHHIPSGVPTGLGRTGSGRPALVRTATATTVIVPVVYTATRSALWEVAVLGDRLGPVVNATTTDIPLRAASAGPDGALVAVGFDGVVLVREAGARTFRRTAQLGVDLRRVIHTPDPRRPHIISSSDASVFEGDAFTGRFERRELGNTARRFDVRALAWTRADGGVDLWAGTDIGLYVRRVGAEWTEVRLDVPPALDRCASEPNACGAHDIVEVVESVEVDHRDPSRERVFIATRSCGGWVALDPSSGCVASLTPDGLPAVRSPIGERTLTLAVQDGVMTAMTEDGLVHELELAP